MEDNQQQYPEYFTHWDRFLTVGSNPGFHDPEEFQEIIEIYLMEDELIKTRQTITYAFDQYPDDQEMLYEILLLLNDFELWNDLYKLSVKFEETGEVWGDGHRLTALLHLGMEEEAFLFFRKLKQKYKNSQEDLTVIYQAMGEALLEVDLFDSSIDVIKEGIKLCGDEVDFLWLLLQNYSSSEKHEEAKEYAQKIQELNPLDAEVWARLGEYYSETGEYENAIDSLENAQSLGYDSPKHLILLMSVYEQNENFNKVLQKAKDYLNLYSSNYLIHITAAKACRHIENWEGSIFYVSNAIRLNPYMDSLYLFQSASFLKLGETAKAIAALEKGIKETKDPTGDLQKELTRIKYDKNNTP